MSVEKKPWPRFGLYSGVSTSVGLLPLLVFLSFLKRFEFTELPMHWLVLAIVIGKAIPEGFFWMWWSETRTLVQDMRSRREYPRNSLTNVWVCLSLMATDSLIEASLVIPAAQAGWHEYDAMLYLTTALIASGCIFGYFSDFQKRRVVLVGVLICSSVMPVLAMSQIRLLLVGAVWIKGLLAHVALMARAGIADTFFWVTQRSEAAG